MLAQGLDIARELGFVRVLCVCDEDNIASERVIIKKRRKIPLIKFVLIVYVINRQIAILQIITIHWYKTRILPQKTAAGFLPYKNPRTFRCGENFI